ncbi:DUF6993 domain-containing protein [Herbiconiux sp. P18]|uniref:DUF6993 domain-containing protein n=1 Tax=Herbiconiux liangxiaofengii TaxID=3342795 RepID=UPI0035B7CDD5
MQTRNGEPRGTLRQLIRRGAVAVAVPIALAGLLTACTSDPEPTATPVASAAPTSAAPTTPAAAPTGTLNPDGSAADNKAFFDETNQALIASNPAAGGVEFTSNLRSKGFDIAAMQVTPDITTVGVAADSIQFSVRWKDECLIGQYGQGAYTSSVMPVLGTGGCLIGQTRTIDW